jgi:surface antigen
MESTVVGRLLILSLCISLLGGCASHKETYVSNSVGSSANNSYSPNKSYINIVTNFMSWKMHKLPAEDQVKQEQAVFFALNNSEEGDVVEWFGKKNNSHGKVMIAMTYPQGSGYCRVVFSQINYKSKTRDFKETACRNGPKKGWTFVR